VTRSFEHRWRVLAACFTLVLCGAIAACGTTAKVSVSTSSSTSSPTSASTTPMTTATSGTTSTTTKVHLTGPTVSQIQGSKTVAVGGKTVTVPTDGNKPVNPSVDDGQQIIISATGFLPAKLYSNPGSAIVWTNLTNQPQQVMFNAFAVTSPVIPPGGTWSWTTQDSESIAYRSASGLTAVVQVLPPGL
jgi:hypothetical protein